MDAALSYLTARMRSASEMRRHLERRGYDQAEVDQALARLRELGYIDDGAYAKELVRAKTAMRPVGRRSLRYTLKQRGVGDEEIDRGLLGYSAEDEQRACDELFDKLLQKHGEGRAALAKIQRALLSRGFDYAAIANSARRAPGEDEGQ
jgi:regulatory protein